jgi:hypothetical protein
MLKTIAKCYPAHCVTKGGHHPEKLVSILYIQRDHPFFCKIIITENMVQAVFYRLLLFTLL